jgi:hypothetical protein
MVKRYCKNRIGDHYVEQGDYHVLQTRDSQIIRPADFASSIEPGMALEMSIILRKGMTFQDSRKNCPRCSSDHTSAAGSDGWVEWLVCP